MNIIEATKKAIEEDACITNPHYKESKIVLYPIFTDDSYLVETTDNKTSISADGIIISWTPQPCDILSDDWEIYSRPLSDEKPETVAKPEVKITADTALPQEGLAEIEALPIFEHKPQMPEEKKKLVGLLMDFVENAVNPKADTAHVNKLPVIAEVLEKLVN